MTISKIWAILPALFWLVGCNSEPVIDGSSQAQFESSIVELRHSLSDSEKERFDGAIQAIIFEQMLEEGAGGTTATISKLDGLNANEIISMAGPILARQAAAQEESVRRAQEQQAEQLRLRRSELLELQQKELEHRKQLEGLALFTVSDARAEEVERPFGRFGLVTAQAINSTDRAIARATFEVTISVPGREIPWASYEAFHNFAGGIEPGESKEIELIAGALGEWPGEELPADSSITIQAIKLRGENDELIFRNDGLSDWDRSRLEALEG